MLGLHFISQGVITDMAGDFYTLIFELRHKGDYDDYIVFERDEVINLLDPARDFIAQIEEILAKK